MKEITLSQGYIALVDDCDVELVGRYSWHAFKHRLTVYAQTSVRIKGTAKKRTIRMHQLILNVLNGFQVDHINGNGLDNRRENLRPSSHQQNNANRRAKSRSGFKGVQPAPNGRWRAAVRKNRTTTWCGTFDSAEEAARAYDKKATEVFGQYAWLNFPKESSSVLAG